MSEYIEKDQRVRNNIIELKKRLVDVFGKDTFTEEELTRDFYTKLRISCGDVFTSEDGIFDLDTFFSNQVKDILLGNIRI